jgi:GTP-binding protein EngB required for normal cell division
MAALQNIPPLPHNFKFRVLVLGRANSGKTSILQNVCYTTDSPEIYRLGPGGIRERVRYRS